MIRQRFLGFAAAVALLLMASPIAALAQKAKGGGCKDIPTRVTMYRQVSGTTLASAIYDDGAGEYVNGVKSVTAVITVCSPETGINAVLNAPGSRKVAFNFPEPLPDSVEDSQKPSFAGRGPFLNSAYINIRSITWSHEPFTTHVGITITKTPYLLRFFPTEADAPNLHGPEDTSQFNTPYETSPATVYPQAYDCTKGGQTLPSWRVVGANPSVTPPHYMQVGALVKNDEVRTPAGHYSLPFEFRIDALACFDY